MQRPHHHRVIGALLSVLTLFFVLLHAPAAQADPFGGIGSLWSLLVPRGKVITEANDVYRKRPLVRRDSRNATPAPATSNAAPAPAPSSAPAPAPATSAPRS
jgi:hypothetical protein